MIDDVVLLKARSELARLNGELRELHLEEERCKLKRSRLEGDKARVQALVDLCELTQRLAKKPQEQISPSFHLEDCHGAKLVIVDKPPAPPVGASKPARRKHKPDGLPTITEMVTVVLREIPGLRAPEIADTIRKRWWPSLDTATIRSLVWRMVRSGHLTQQDGRYALTGAGHRQNGSGHDVSVAK
jgi:hypothetical protein